MKNNYLKKLLIICFTLIIGKGYAQAPVNNNCTGAILVPVALDSASCVPTQSLSTLNATKSTFTSACWSTSQDDDIWYKFTADTSFIICKISNLSVSNGFIGYAIFKGSCSSAEIGCASLNANGTAVFDSLVSGTTYYLSLFYTGIVNRGTFDICLYHQSPPVANDDCTGAIAVTNIAPNFASCVPTHSTNTANANVGTYSVVASCNNLPKWYDDDIWYSFVADSVTMAIKIDHMSTRPTSGALAAYVFEGSCTGADFDCFLIGNGSIHILDGLTVGTTYYISLFYYGNTDRGTFDVSFFHPDAPPANDDCTGAITIPVAADLTSCTPTLVDTKYATIESYSATPVGFEAYYDDGVWYQFTATADPTYLNFSNLDQTVPVGWSLFDAPCGSAEILNNALTTTPDSVLTPLNIGSTYYLCVFYKGATNRGTFNMCAYTNTVGVGEFGEIGKSLSVYPNPAVNYLTVKFHTRQVKTLALQLTDMNGKEIYNRIENNFAGDYNSRIDLKGLSKGIYLLKIVSDNDAVTRKVVIQ